ncbi:MAG: hypothetical protein HOO67_08170 [Candidatus Peribacteraceae bacterium]|nr:hypothetical protein [Candidatus Peribacteraceae bacterium]
MSEGKKPLNAAGPLNAKEDEYLQRVVLDAFEYVRNQRGQEALREPNGVYVAVNVNDKTPFTLPSPRPSGHHLRDSGQTVPITRIAVRLVDDRKHKILARMNMVFDNTLRVENIYIDYLNNVILPYRRGIFRCLCGAESPANEKPNCPQCDKKLRGDAEVIDWHDVVRSHTDALDDDIQETAVIALDVRDETGEEGVVVSFQNKDIIRTEPLGPRVLQEDWFEYR